MKHFRHKLGYLLVHLADKLLEDDDAWQPEPVRIYVPPHVDSTASNHTDYFIRWN